MTTQNLLTVNQACKALAIGSRKLWQMTNDGEIPHVRIGKSVRYNPKELEAWVNANTLNRTTATQVDSGVSGVRDHGEGRSVVGSPGPLANAGVERQPAEVHPQAGRPEIPPQSDIPVEDRLAYYAMNVMPVEVAKICQHRGWAMDHMTRGCYLHLEASELVEALRGKRGTPAFEAADVLIVLMSITQHNNIAWEEVIKAAYMTLGELFNKPPYPGEHAPNRKPEPSPEEPPKKEKKKLPPLTDRQKMIYNYICTRLKHGINPSYKEIALFSNVATSTAYTATKQLESLGYIERQLGRARSFHIPE